MNLVIEDGTNVAGANSYASADDMYLYAAERNIEIENDQTMLEGYLLLGMDYLDLFSHRFNGLPVLAGQRLAFPRNIQNLGSFVNLGVPEDMKRAQIIAAIAARSVDLTPITTGTEMDVTRKTIGPITVEYERAGSQMVPRIPMVDALLRRYFNGGFGQPSVIRG